MKTSHFCCVCHASSPPPSERRATDYTFLTLKLNTVRRGRKRRQSRLHFFVHSVRERERLVGCWLDGWEGALGCQRTTVAQFLLANGWQMVAIGSSPLWIVCHRRRRFSRKQLMAFLYFAAAGALCAKNRLVQGGSSGRGQPLVDIALRVALEYK